MPNYFNPWLHVAWNKSNHREKISKMPFFGLTPYQGYAAIGNFPGLDTFRHWQPAYSLTCNFLDWATCWIGRLFSELGDYPGLATFSYIFSVYYCPRLATHSKVTLFFRHSHRLPMPEFRLPIPE